MNPTPKPETPTQEAATIAQRRESDDKRAERLPRVLERYAQDIDRYGKPVDSGLAPVLRFAATNLITAQTKLRESEAREVGLREALRDFDNSREAAQSTHGAKSREEHAEILIAAIRERLSQPSPNSVLEELQDLRAWKESAMAVEREWDAQAIAKLLGATLSQSCRKVVAKRVPEVLEELERLRAENAMLKEYREHHIDSDSIVSSCDCLTKTNDIQLHKAGCKYRLIVERNTARAQLAGLQKRVDGLEGQRNTALARILQLEGWNVEALAPPTAASGEPWQPKFKLGDRVAWTVQPWLPHVVDEEAEREGARVGVYREDMPSRKKHFYELELQHYVDSVSPPAATEEGTRA